MSNAKPRCHALLALVLVLWQSALGVGQTRADEATFLRDLAALTRHPHRLAGTEEGLAAATYIREQLEAIDGVQVLPLQMPVWQTHVEKAELTVAGRTVPVLPLRPNLVVPSIIDEPGGLTAPLIYVGFGNSEAYGNRSPEGKIVVLEYDSYEHWERAFALGARAVVFIGSPDATPQYPKHTGLPANFPRFYVPAEVADELNLRQDHDAVTLVSRVAWKLGHGLNVLAYLPGTDPQFIKTREAPELIVLATGFDSYGVVPHLSPGARKAANVAALLQTTRHLAANRPRRDVLIMFLDNDARLHQGARYVYDAFSLKPADLQKQIDLHEQERQTVGDMIAMLGDPARLADPADAQRRSVFDFLFNEAYYIHSDLRLEQVRRRIARDAIKKSDPVRYEAMRSEIEAAERQILRWDNLRRTLHFGTFDRLRQVMGELTEQAATPTAEQRGDWARTIRSFHVRDGFESLLEDGRPDDALAEARAYLDQIDVLIDQSRDKLRRRVKELDELLEEDAQRLAISQTFNQHWIALHVDFNFGDSGPQWGVVVGNRLDQLYPYKKFGASSDTPGYYGRVLGAIRDAATVLPESSGLAQDTLKDTAMGTQFAPGIFQTTGFVAGTYGFYNVSLMTGYDRRARDGHPIDTVDRLDAGAVYRQAAAATPMLQALADRPDISLPRQFSDQSRTKRVSLSDGRPTGDYATLRVTGSLSEDRPAFHSVMAIWPARSASAAADVWTTLEKAVLATAFDPIVLERVDMNGRFPVIGVQREFFNNVNTLGAMFDDDGRVAAITTQKTLSRDITKAARVELFQGRGFALGVLPGQKAMPGLFKVLRAASDSTLQTTRALVGQLGNFAFFYISQQDLNTGVDRVKIFQPHGPAMLGATARDPFGNGVALDILDDRPPLLLSTASDLWTINESRLSTLRTRGVTSEDLELLHSRARRALEDGRGDNPELPEWRQESRLIQSAALSQAVYSPLRQSMDDLVHAIVVLLLLAIPFAFAVERLLFCATTIYGRLLGFTAAFLVTFGLLYTMHPGFAIASTPVIIFLAFAILLLSILVIHIIVRKFRTELKAMQGQRVGLHDVEVSRMGTVLAAVSMGMSTMRRRPTRTFLTAITVIMLTFTILSFASFTRQIGVRSVYEGPIGDEASGDVLIRKLDYSAMPHHSMELVRGLEGEGGGVYGHYWLVRASAADLPFSVARPSPAPPELRTAMTLDAVFGVTLEELKRWPAMRAALRGEGDEQALLDSLERGGAFLPSIVLDRLGLQTGDPVLLNGQPTFVAGTFDSAALQRLRHLDGQSVLPVNFQDPSAQQAQQQAGGGEAESTANDMVDKDFVHLNADQIAITSARFVQQQGGNMHSIVMYLDSGIEPLSRASEVARVVPMPLWARGSQGVERMILTTLTELSGGMALAVPVILGGLIIFGTLLGSITDREKEIYTFSALGLAPGHVGVLFFAEAAVYAVVGGMGGQLLAQIVAQVSAYLAQLGLISPPQINYSSTNSLFAIGIVMATVIISAIYPALRASRSANPGLARAWKMPPPEGDRLEMTFPFTVSAYDITGVVSFLAEHFERHDDAGLGSFAAQNVRIGRTRSDSDNGEGHLYLSADLALAPFDLGVTQAFTLTARPSEIPGVDEVAIAADRSSGANGDWLRANRVFLRDLRRQFLLWRTLSAEMIESYRMNTLTRLREDETSGRDADADDLTLHQPATTA